jgi:hypothetical protein
VVSVNAYGLLATTTFPLLVRVFQPHERLKPGDVSQTKPQLAVEIVEELVARGFPFSVVLADSLSGESPEFIGALHRLKLQEVVAIRSNHAVWLPPGQHVRQTRFRPFERVFTDGSREQRFIRETISGTRQAVRSYQITTAPATLPPETTWELMTNQPGKIEPTVGNTFGLRTWVDDGFKHSKDDLGWADDRVTDSASIERWWELVIRRLHAGESADRRQRGAGPRRCLCPPPPPPAAQTPVTVGDAASLEAHPAWDQGRGWKHHRTTLRLLLQPYICSCLLFPWLAWSRSRTSKAVQTGLAALGSLIDTFRLVLSSGQKRDIAKCDHVVHLPSRK